MIAVATRADGAANTPALPQLALHPARPRIILALDLGSSTGWAMRSREGAVTSGIQTFRPNRFEGGGMAFLRFNHWLSELNEAAGPIGAVFFEEVRAYRGTLAAHIYGGFLAHLEAWAEFRTVPYEGVPVATIKKFATGKGNAGKEEVIAAVRRIGHAPADDNEADALALLEWALVNRVEGTR